MAGRVAAAAPPEYLYYNATIVNGKTTGEFDDAPARYTESRATPLIEDVSLYKMAPVRVVINGGGIALPILRATVDTTQSNPDVLAYRVTAEFQWTGLPVAPASSVVVPSGCALTLNFVDLDGHVYVRGVSAPLAAGTYGDAAFAVLVETALNTAMGGAATDVVIVAPTFAISIANVLLPTDPAAFGVQLDFTADDGTVDSPAQLMGCAPGSLVTIMPGQTKRMINYFGAAAGTVVSPLFVASYPVVWEPEDLTVGRPSTIATPTEPSTEYYYAYTVSHVLDLFNVAFRNVFNDSASSLNATPGVPTVQSLAGQFQAWWSAQGYAADLYPGVTTKAPELVLDSATGLMTIHLDQYGFAGGPLATRTSEPYEFPRSSERCGLLFNSAFYNLINTFPMLAVTPLPANAFSNWRLNPAQGARSTMPWVPGLPSWAVRQDSTSLDSMWSPIDAIVLSTSSIPVVQEEVGVPTLTSEGSFTGVGGFAGAAVSVPIVTDIALPLVSCMDWRSEITYAPVAQWRFVDMGNARASISAITFDLFWRDRLNQQLRPLLLPPGGTVTIKVALVLK